MLSPEKHIDLDKSVLMLAGTILRHILKKKTVKVDALLSFVEKKSGDGITENFFSALIMLYSLDKLNYLYSSDTLVLVVNK